MTARTVLAIVNIVILIVAVAVVARQALKK